MRKNVHSSTDKRRPLSAASSGLRGAAGQRKYLTGEERRRFIAAAERTPPKLRTLCLTLVYSGCRISEALTLCAGDVEPDAGLIAIRSLKKRGALVIRQIPVPPRLLAEITRVHGLAPDADPDTPLWPWGRTRAWQLIKLVMAQARIRQLPASPKGLRHAFGVHAVLSGVPITLVQKWLGHADVSTTAIYTDVLGPEERAIAERMW